MWHFLGYTKIILIFSSYVETEAKEAELKESTRELETTKSFVEDPVALEKQSADQSRQAPAASGKNSILSRFVFCVYVCVTRSLEWWRDVWVDLDYKHFLTRIQTRVSIPVNHNFLPAPRQSLFAACPVFLLSKYFFFIFFKVCVMHLLS